MLLSIVIPAHNEEARIKKTLFDYLTYFKEEAEILVVLNGCKDNTLSVVKEVKKAFPRTLKIENLEEASKGGAVRRGFELSQNDLIGFVDADEATSPKEFEKLINQIDDFDGVIASRSQKGSIARMNFARKIVHKVFSWLVRLLFGLPYKDTQCGAKVFNKEAIKKVLPEMKINNMVFDVELLLLLRKYSFRINEAPTIWQGKESSASLGSPNKFLKVSFKMFITLLQLKKRFIYEKRKANI
jgi:glycosyltransferase involved in cell wall biosynthesis